VPFLINPRARWFDRENPTIPLSGGQVYFYQPGTLTLKTTWSDVNKVTPLDNPITLDTDGYPTIDGTAQTQIFGDGAYRVIVEDSDGNPQYDDSYVFSGSSSAIIDSVDTITELRDYEIDNVAEVFVIVKNDALLSDGGDNKLYTWDATNTEDDNPPYIVVPTGSPAQGRFISYNQKDLKATGVGFPVTGETKRPGFDCSIAIGADYNDNYLLGTSYSLQHMQGTFSTIETAKESYNKAIDVERHGCALRTIGDVEILTDINLDPLIEDSGQSNWRTSLDYNEYGDILIGCCRWINDGGGPENAGTWQPGFIRYKKNGSSYEPAEILTYDGGSNEVVYSPHKMIGVPGERDIAIAVLSRNQSLGVIDKQFRIDFSTNQVTNIYSEGTGATGFPANACSLYVAPDGAIISHINIYGQGDASVALATTDGGLTWAARSSITFGWLNKLENYASAPSIKYFISEPLVDGNDIYQGDEKGQIYKSTDSAATWAQEGSTMPSADQIVGIKKIGSTFWIATASGLYSTLNFTSYTKVPSNVVDIPVRLLQDDSGDIYVITVNNVMSPVDRPDPVNHVRTYYIYKYENGQLNLHSAPINETYQTTGNPPGSMKFTQPVLASSFCHIPGTTGITVSVGIHKQIEDTVGETYAPYIGRTTA
jgi:hypothetical protein